MCSEEENALCKKYYCKGCCSPGVDIAISFTFRNVYCYTWLSIAMGTLMIQQWGIPGKEKWKSLV